MFQSTILGISFVLNNIKIENVTVNSSESPLSSRLECIIKFDKIEKYPIVRRETFNILDEFYIICNDVFPCRKNTF